MSAVIVNAVTLIDHGASNSAARQMSAVLPPDDGPHRRSLRE